MIEMRSISISRLSNNQLTTSEG